MDLVRDTLPEYVTVSEFDLSQPIVAGENASIGWPTIANGIAVEG